MLTQQLEKGRRELDYLNSVLDTIPLAEGEKDLQEIRQELTDTGYLRRPSKAKGREKRGGLQTNGVPLLRRTAHLRGQEQHPKRPAHLQAGLQERYMVPHPEDPRLPRHSLDGGRAPDLQSLNEAACLAAWFSQARGASRVPVDYTPVKYVKKAQRGPPRHGDLHHL